MLTQSLIDDHRDCDEHLLRSENLLASGDRESAATAWSRFRRALEHHLHSEARVLFVEFEQATGESQGPTAIMRMEHDQMRTMVEQMQQAVDGAEDEAFLDLTETLHLLIQQHNMKEEQMLYPMMEQVLGERAEALIDEHFN